MSCWNFFQRVHFLYIVDLIMFLVNKTKPQDHDENHGGLV